MLGLVGSEDDGLMVLGEAAGVYQAVIVLVTVTMPPQGEPEPEPGLEPGAV